MNVLDLIHLYERWKEAHEPIGASLSEKMRALRRGFGSMPVTASGEDYAKRAKEVWPSAQAGTISRILRQLRAVFNHAAEVGALQRAPKIPLPSVYDVQPQMLTAKDVELLLDHVAATEAWAYPAALLLAHTGARLGEAMNIDPKEDFGQHGIAIVRRAARRTKTVVRTVPYTPRMRAAMGAGLYKASPFVTSTGRRMADTRSASALLGRVLRSSCVALGLPQINPHALRHGFAGIVAEYGGSLEDIASLLGHANTTMSARYRGLVRNRAERILQSVGT